MIELTEDEAAERLEELLDKARAQGPQVLVIDGQGEFIIVEKSEFERLKAEGAGER